MRPDPFDWRSGRRWRAGRGPGGRRPPWWPENEAWPPAGPEAWRRMRRGFAQRVAFLVVSALLALVLLAAGVVWLLGVIFGAHAISLIGGFAVLLLLALVAARLVRRARLAVAPMGDLIEASARVEARQFGTRVPERGSSELRSLARAFNAMSARLAATEEQRRRLLAEVSHELRTPLTVIQGNVEAMLDGLYPTDRAHLERIQAETRQLERLIEDLRTLALADAGALPLHREPSDLAEIARDVVVGFEPQAAGRGVALRVDAAADPAELELDPPRMHQVIANLVSNALRHTGSGGRVTVSVRPGPGSVTLAVADTGSGMAPDAVAHAFDRFWRSGESAGAGLGLAIVRDLVTAHGGTVEMRSAAGEGTTVTCTLPR